MVNVPALQTALDYVTEHPDKHDQEKWASVPRKKITAAVEANGGKAARLPADCGTAFCLFGAALVLNGYSFLAIPQMDMWNRLSYVVKDSDSTNAPLFARDAGRDLLGLDADMTHALSDSNNTLLDLWALGWMISGGALVLPTVRFSTGPAITLEAIHTMIHQWARETDENGEPWSMRARLAAPYLAELDAFTKTIVVD